MQWHEGARLFPKVDKRPFKQDQKMIQRRKNMQRQIDEWDRRVRDAKPDFEQARHLINKFGGIVPVSVIIGQHPNQILWRYLGTAKDGRQCPMRGLFPTFCIIQLCMAARQMGVYLGPEDIYPDILGSKNSIDKLQKQHKDLRSWLEKINPTKENMRKLEDELVSLASTPD